MDINNNFGGGDDIDSISSAQMDVLSIESSDSLFGVCTSCASSYDGAEYFSYFNKEYEL